MYGNEDNNSQSKKKVKESKVKEKEIIYGQFEKFWRAYPRKIKKQKVLEWFEKNKPPDDLFVNILNALECFKKSKEWIANNGQFIPHPTTWLNQKRWEDFSVEGGDSIGNGNNEIHNSQYDEANGTTL